MNNAQHTWAQLNSTPRPSIKAHSDLKLPSTSAKPKSRHWFSRRGSPRLDGGPPRTGRLHPRATDPRGATRAFGPGRGSARCLKPLEALTRPGRAVGTTDAASFARPSSPAPGSTGDADPQPSPRLGEREEPFGGPGSLFGAVGIRPGPRATGVTGEPLNGTSSSSAAERSGQSHTGNPLST